MPRLKHYRCKTGEPPHDEAFACEECGDDVCGYHAEQVAADGPAIWLCPTCAAADRPTDARCLDGPKTHEGEYARNQREAIEHIETLPPSERSAVANRPGQTPPSTPEGSSDA